MRPEPSYWEQREQEGTAGPGYRRHPPGDLPVGRSAVQRERDDLAAVLQAVEGAPQVLGGVLALLDARARTVGALRGGSLARVAASQMVGLLEDVARAAGVTPVPPATPLQDDSDLDRKSTWQLLREARADVERAERMPNTRRLRSGINRAAAQQDTTEQEQGQ